MAKVNPPPQLRIPRAFQNDIEVRSFFEQQQTILFQLWQKVGGGNDNFDELESQLNEFDELEAIYGQSQNSNVSVQTSNYTTLGSEIVVCDSAITVTLNDTPDDRETVTVKIRNGDVVIDGNGRDLDGESSITFVAEDLQGQPTVDIIYLLETDDWIIV
jgi:hypothetical protein